MIDKEIITNTMKFRRKNPPLRNLTEKSVILYEINVIKEFTNTHIYTYIVTITYPYQRHKSNHF